MVSEDDGMRELAERVTRLEGAVDAILLQVEAGDNSIRQLLTFDRDRFERIETELKRVAEMLASMPPTSEVQTISDTIKAMDEDIRGLKTFADQHKGRSETWASIAKTLVPPVLSFIGALLVAYFAWRLGQVGAELQQLAP